MPDEISRLVRDAIDDQPRAPLLSPLKVATAVDEITDRLITAIAIGEVQPGSRLPSEREMAAMLKVGRSTLREAVGRLTALGLVEIRRGRNGGAYVRTSWTEASGESVRRTLVPLWGELEQLFDLCSLVEGTVARAAAERRSARDIEQIRSALADFVIAVNAGGSEAAEQEADARFHQAIRAATRNSQLDALNTELITRISLGFPFEPWRDPELGNDDTQRAVTEHTDLATAIADGDAERAGHIAQHHSLISADIIRETLRRAGIS